MITKQLLCLSASLLLAACGSRTRDIPKNSDTEYLELVQQAADISESAGKWNDKCGDTPFSKDCAADQKMLSELWSRYIVRAAKFKTEGSDCRAEMRVKIINFNLQIALFNVGCAGTKHTDTQEEQCVSESAFIEQNRVQLHGEMKDCETETQK